MKRMLPLLGLTMALSGCGSEEPSDKESMEAVGNGNLHAAPTKAKGEASKGASADKATPAP